MLTTTEQKRITPTDNEYEIVIKMIDSKEDVFTTSDNSSIYNLKKKIEKKMGYHINTQALIFSGSSFNE